MASAKIKTAKPSSFNKTMGFSNTAIMGSSVLKMFNAVKTIRLIALLALI
jgi:hypothetical protein